GYDVCRALAPTGTSIMAPSRRAVPPFSLVFPAVVLAAGLAGCRPAAPIEAGRAALVLRGPAGRLQRACVRLTGDSTNGEQLLLDSGWEVSLDAANPMGSIVCAIDGEGCSFPAEKCFCQCSTLGTCRYWAYFTLGPDGRWVYSPLGARAQPVINGDLHAWVWVSGASSAPGTLEALLPDLRFADVCPPP
ncbi:MAG: hypothetical protein MUO23_04245, partial [Anaerolineales bacterium]|nr:hypothetical protein [Anaerolineales bacterium]